MNFLFSYTKTASFFHFVSNLTEWHYSCRKRDNKLWLEKTGPLTLEEKETLERLRTLLKQYNYGEQFLGKPFIRSPEGKVWPEVKKWVGQAGCQVLQEAFAVFDKRFEKVWTEEKPKLAQWQKRLQELTSSSKQTQGLVKDLENFFNASAQQKQIKVFLLVNGTPGCGGNANVGDNAVVLDCSHTDPKLTNWVLATLWHEIIHLVFEKRHFEPLLKEFLGMHGREILDSHVGKLIGQPTPVIKEAVISALTPDGYLAEKYFDIDVQGKLKHQLGPNYKKIKQNPKNFRLWYLFAAQKLIPVVENYLKEQKAIDSSFLERTFSVYQLYLALLEE